ncbi:bifunctional glycosyltransferase family 2/GtrA family protein [Planktomarina temperata]|nr:bifunctional glycosyltransferase family 2/GtrA family protein [Planktomarina temperata]
MISALLIPAYEPTGELTRLIQNLGEQHPIVVVDDGSQSCLAKHIFENLEEMPNVTILKHTINLGKGAALKTGLKYIRANIDSDWVVTLDADGQHLASDVVRVANATSDPGNHLLVLGSRKFTNATPLKSRIGNNFTALIFKYVYGYDLKDTQTGLRGIHKSIIPEILRIKGNKYEFETDMLLLAINNRIPIICLSIETIYINDNDNSHFKPIRDSFLIYKSIFAFAASGVLSFALDYLIFITLFMLTDLLLASVIVSRLISGMFNFAVNLKIFGGSKSYLRNYIFFYSSLFLSIMLASYAGTYIMVEFGVSAAFAKPVTDFMLFFVSYYSQKKIFCKLEL